MDAMKCDRCGKYYDKYPGVCECNKGTTVAQRYRVPYNRLFVVNAIYDSVPSRHFDLCPDCMTEFDGWMNKKGE